MHVQIYVNLRYKKHVNYLKISAYFIEGIYDRPCLMLFSDMIEAVFYGVKRQSDTAFYVKTDE
jgi:hypothetical protein